MVAISPFSPVAKMLDLKFCTFDYPESSFNKLNYFRPVKRSWYCQEGGGPSLPSCQRPGRRPGPPPGQEANLVMTATISQWRIVKGILEKV